VEANTAPGRVFRVTVTGGVRSFVASNNYTFTVVNDFEAVVNSSYRVDALPSVFVIDKAGTIRYFNRGFEPTIRDVLTTQIESLSN